MDETARGLGLAAIERYADAWAELPARISHRFARAEARDRALPGGPAGTSRAQERVATRGGHQRDPAGGIGKTTPNRARRAKLSVARKERDSEDAGWSWSLSAAPGENVHRPAP